MADIVSAQDLRSGYHLADLLYGYSIFELEQVCHHFKWTTVLGRSRLKGPHLRQAQAYIYLETKFISQARHLCE